MFIMMTLPPFSPSLMTHWFIAYESFTYIDISCTPQLFMRVNASHVGSDALRTTLAPENPKGEVGSKQQERYVKRE